MRRWRTNLVDLAVKKPVATGVIFTFIAGAGLFAWNRLSQEVMPDLNFPQLSIVTEYTLAGPREIENLITKPIEEAVGTVKNIKRVRSLSKEGKSIVNLDFAWGTQMDFASLNVREKLDLVKAKLPSEAKEPTVVKFNPFKTPILILSLAMDQEMEPLLLSQIAEKTISNRLQKVQGVASVTLSGTREKEIKVLLDQTRLAANRISLTQFIKGLSQANYQGSAGTVKDESYDYAVRVTSSFQGVNEVQTAVIAVDQPNTRSQQGQRNRTQSTFDRERQRQNRGDQRLISVSQLGRVEEGLKEKTSFSRRNQKENITVLIQKQDSASTILTVDRLKEEIEELRPLLPSDVSLDIIYDQSEIIKSGIQDVLMAVFGGGFFAFFVLLLFLGNTREALIVSVVIPASTLCTLVFMKLGGLSINIISLGGLALGVGMLVDAAICVTENINRRRVELKESGLQAAIQGAKEVASPITSSSLTTISVFLPLIFVVGLIGQLFRDLSLTVTLSQIISILVALTLVPMLCALLNRPAQKTKMESAAFKKFRNHYLGVLDWSFSHPKLMWGGIGGALLLSLFLLSLLPKQFLPRVDAQQLVLKLTMPKGTRLQKTDKISKTIEATLEEQNEIEHTTVTIGSSSESPITLLDKNEGQILIDLAKKRKKTAHQIQSELTQRLNQLNLEGGRFEISEAGGPLSFAKDQATPVMIYLKGTRLAALEQGAKTLTTQLAGVSGLNQIRSSLALPAPEIQLDIDKKRASRNGLTVTQVAKTALTAYHGRVVTKIFREGKEIPIRVQLKKQDRNNIQKLKNLLLTGQGNQTWPLDDMAKVRLGQGPSQIERLDQQRVVLVQANTTKAFGRASQQKLDALLQDFSVSGVTWEIAGEKKAQKESFISLIVTLVVAILLVYMVMAVQFESLRQPFVILFTIPLSIIGMAAGLFIMGKTISAIAAMGLLLLAGIVVNNGIVLIDFVNSAKETTTSLKNALRLACQTRLRPILLTATTTIVGLIPLALGLGEGAELQAPMAITVIFGLLVSTGLTLVALPTLYYVFERKRGKTP